MGEALRLGSEIACLCGIYVIPNLGGALLEHGGVVFRGKG
jgi:hypothetical protein